MSSVIQVVLVLGAAAWVAGAALPSLAQSTTEQVATAQLAAHPPPMPPPATTNAAAAARSSGGRTVPVTQPGGDGAKAVGAGPSGLAVYLMLSQGGPLPYAQR